MCRFTAFWSAFAASLALTMLFGYSPPLQAGHPDDACLDQHNTGGANVAGKVRNQATLQLYSNGIHLPLNTQLQASASATSWGSCEIYGATGNPPACGFIQSDLEDIGHVNVYELIQNQQQNQEYPIGTLVTPPISEEMAYDWSTPPINQWVSASGENLRGILTFKFEVQVDYTFCNLTPYIFWGPSITVYMMEENRCPEGDANSDYGNPCNAATGNKHETQVDYDSPGTGLNLTRSYNSQIPIDYGLGHGWVTNYHRRLERYQSGSIRLRRAHGGGDVFTGGGTWTGPADSVYLLTEDATGYTVTLQNGSTERYDLNGRLVSDTDHVGRQTSYAYNSDGRLQTVTGPFGHTLTFSYTANGRLDKVTTPSGQDIRFGYDASDNLTTVTYPDNKIRTYHYELGSGYPYHALTGITDEENRRFATYGYDATSGKATLTQHATTTNGSPQEKFTLVYDSATQTTVTRPDNKAEVLTFQEQHGIKKLVSRTLPTASGGDGKTLTQVFDSNNNLTDVTDEEGGKTHYTYNSYNQRTSMTEGYQTSSARTTEYEYLSSTVDLITKVKTPSVSGGTNKKEVITAYNADRTIASITLNGYQPDGTPLSRVTSFPQYNSQKQVTQIDGPRTDVTDTTTLEYYLCTTSYQCGQLKKITNALGHETTFDLYDANGRLTQMTDANALVTTYAYDLRGRVLTITQTLGATTRTTTYTYWGNGQVKTVTLPNNTTLTYGYDDAQDLRSITDDLGNKIEYTYDIRGNRNAEDLKDSGGNLKKWVDYAHDLRNRIDTINAGGSVTDLLYDAVGELEAEADPNANPTDFTYDPLGRLDSVLDALSNTTDYGYDAQDQLTSLTAPNGVATTYVYDDLGNVLKETSPDRGTTLYGYDAAGNMTCKSDGRYSGAATSCGQVASRWIYAYDALNRATSIDYLSVSGTDVSLGYDAGTAQKGRLTSLSYQADGSATIVTKTFAYDPFGNVVTSTQTVPKGGSPGVNKTFTTGYEYNGDNSLKKITYPSGRIVEYVRDGAGRIQQIKATFNSTTTTFVTDVTYYPFGPPATIVYNNGLTQTRTHDSQYRLTNLTLAGGSTLDQLVYTYDSAANVDYLQDQLNSTYTRDYAYDVLNRLKWDSGVSSTNPTYSYDANGNRLTRTASTGFPAQTLTYVSGANKINQFNSQTVSYDGMGSVTNNANGLTFTTDAAGRMRTTVIPASTALTTLYNGLGELARVLMQAYDGCSGSWNTQYWEYYNFATDGRPLHLVQEYLSRVQWDWVYLDNLPVLQFQDSYDGSGTYQGTTTTYLHTDHLGTPRIGTNTSAAVSWRYRSDAFGKATISGSHTVRLRLPGQIDLGIGGINYNYFRDYDPNVGRYLESDPIGLDPGLNTYLYADGNPLSKADPTGQNPAQGALWGGNVGTLIGSAFGPAGALAGRVLGAFGGAAIGWGILQFCENEETCEERLALDMETCKALGRRNGKLAYRLCEKQAMERYADCLSGRDMNPPLPPWNTK